jgi:hypothetical protein
MERIRSEVRTALRAFKYAMEQADTERLWLLHGGLEKDTLRIVRGSWGGRREGRAGAERAAACPLTTLFVGVPGGDEDLRRSEGLSDRWLRARGLSAGTFYRAWDAGWIPTRTLLGVVDAEITQRTLGGRPPR